MRQYIPALAREGIALDELATPLGAYPPPQRWLRPLWGAAALAASLPRVAMSWSYDASLLQRELLSTLVTLEPLTRKPRVLDVDDAIFLYRDGRPARRLAQLCDAVVCGNSFLAEWFSAWNRNTAVVPTAIDTERYTPRLAPKDDGELVVGWIGTSGNLGYLHGIGRALRAALEVVPSARLRVVCDRAPAPGLLPSGQLEYLAWTERTEVADIQGMDVGIMPLEDSPWARGKCSFKMLQYLSCGLPVVVSPVGMNAEILALGQCGLGAATEAQWTERLVGLLESAELRSRLGAEGRRIAESRFSIPVVTPLLARYLRGR